MIKIGNVYVRKNKSSPIKIVNKIGEGVFECETISGAKFNATENTINDWKEIITEKKEIISSNKKILNRISLRKVVIDILKKSNCSMNSMEILDVINQNKLFHFSENAKTPYNSIHARLSEYIRKSGSYSVIEKDKRGYFLYKR